MKKLLILLVLVTSFPAFAGSYTITTTAGQDNTLARAVTRANKATCNLYAQGNTCTQAQARKEFCRRAGFGGVYDPVTKTTSPLVAACAGSSQVNVWADPATFLQDFTVTQIKDTFGKNNAADDQAAFTAALEAAAQAQKDAACVALGLTAGCI